MEAGKPDYGDAAMRGAIWSVHATVTRPPAPAPALRRDGGGGAEGEGRVRQKSRGHIARRTDGDDDDSFADQNTYKQLSARLRP